MNKVWNQHVQNTQIEIHHWIEEHQAKECNISNQFDFIIENGKPFKSNHVKIKWMAKAKK